MGTTSVKREKIRLKNALNIAGALLLLAAVFLPSKYSGSVYGYLPGLSLLALYLMSALYLVAIRRSIRFDTEAPEALCGRGQTISALIKIRNNSVMTCAKLQVELYVSGFFPDEETTVSKTLSLNGKSETGFPLNAVMEHIGLYEAGVREVRVYDLLGIISVPVKGGGSFPVTVLPRNLSSNEVRLDERQLTESRNIRKTAASDGFDYTGVREYALGDSMKRIHWKLSAHSVSYMTKITESSKRSDLAVIMDFVSGSGERKISPFLYDIMVETSLDLIRQAASKDIEYSLLFVGKDKNLARVIPKGEQDYPDLVRVLPALFTRGKAGILDGAGILQKESHLGNRSSNLILCTTEVTAQLVQELISVRQQQRQPELYCIVSPEKSFDSPSAAMLNVLDDYDIRYRLITAEMVS